jgi:hypothetical protein
VGCKRNEHIITAVLAFLAVAFAVTLGVLLTDL